jgi:uncharacterized glyoxalase superfamily protein PhnB
MAKPASSPVPAGWSPVTAYLTIRGVAQALDFYKKAFGAEIGPQMPGPGGLIMHAEMRIGNVAIAMCDEMPEMKYWLSPQSLNGTTCTLHIYVADADALYNRAVSAGAQPVWPMHDAFWGDRYGRVRDPFGHEWAIAAHQWDYTPEEMMQKAQEFFASMAQAQS